MSMFSDITTEGVVHRFVLEIKKKLSECTDPRGREAYKHMGRFALLQLEYSPEWEKKFRLLFKESPISKPKRR